MSPGIALALVLVVVVLVAGVRVRLSSRGQPGSGPRTGLRLAGMLASAALFYFFLLPPDGASRSRSLTVLTAGSRAEEAAAASGGLVVALPEAPAFAGVTRVPDLATALRRHPGATPLHVRGAGLVARDRDAAAGQAIEFDAAPLPAGVVELIAPVHVGRGRQFVVRGRANGAAQGQVELLDPAGARIDQARLDEHGAFELRGRSGPAGRMDYRLRLKAKDEGLLEEITIPLEVRSGAPLKVWLLAGGPSPELKYLRRWARDAGLALHTQLAVGGGVDLGDPPLPMTAATLRGFDLVVLDERSWRTLGEPGRRVLREAVREGLGVLLRLTADPGESDRRLLQEWGFTVDIANLTRSLRLAGSEAADPVAAPETPDSAETRATDTTPLLSRRPLRLRATDGQALHRAPDGEPLALWRPEGRGRIALWTLSDSYRLVLAGRRTAHGSLWAQTVGTLARPSGLAPKSAPVDARVGERTSLCRVGDGTAVQAPDGTRTALVRDPASGPRACAAYWPTQSGWHERIDGDLRTGFPVRAADETRALAAATLRSETERLARAAPGRSTTAPTPVPGPRWPWGLAWLLVSAGLWWLERPRR